jgi:phosphoribosylanthranilate isomerase
MPVQVKICGLTTPETIDAAIAGGASHIGFVFFPPSPRNIDPRQAAALTNRASGRVKIVGLFVNPDSAYIRAIKQEVKLDIVQLHGDERPEDASIIDQRCGLETWKAIPVRTRADLEKAKAYQGSVSRLLYDAKPHEGCDVPGGNGLRFDWALLDGFVHPLPWILAGGLTPENVSEAIRTTGADFVDVSSGVESAPGIKDVDKIAAFLKAASIL